MTESLADRIEKWLGVKVLTRQEIGLLNAVRALAAENAELKDQMQNYCGISNSARKCVQAVKEERDELKAQLEASQARVQELERAVELATGIN